MNNDRVQSLIKLGIENGQKGNFAEAIELFKNILEFDVDNIEALTNIGTAYEKMGDNKKALEYYKKVESFNPNSSNAHYNLGIVYKKIHEYELAIKAYKKEIENHPGHVDSHNNLANIYTQINKKELAIEHYKKVLSINPNHKNALYNYEWLLREICDWDELNKIEARTLLITLEDLENTIKPTEHPFASLVKTTDNKLNLQIAKLWSKEFEKQTVNEKPFQYKKRAEKIKIGYLGGDFYNHPVAHLIGKMFRYHDREKFQIFAYSYTKPDKSEYKNWSQESADHFIDLYQLTDYEAAIKINRDGINILVDLTGYTKNGRMGILAYRPTPVQVSWLGFPGTTGANFIDYIIADKTVLPAEEASSFYTEKPLYMPNCYQITDGYHWEKIEKSTKKAENLPDDTIVFGCFCQSFKITPEIFGVWMTILKKVPNSVLWLYSLDELVQTNLKNHAQKSKVDPKRIIFAKHVSKSKHLGRFSLCDLMLDTYPYNGHTTTTDALWAGVPVITLKGNHFASRVAESILNGVGMPQLVASSLSEYVNLAFEYSQKKNNREIKNNIRASRNNSSLFNNQLFVRDFETIIQSVIS